MSGSEEGQPEYVGGGVESPCGGLGLPKIADRMEYSRFAASEPNGKLESKGTSKVGDSCNIGSAIDGEVENNVKGCLSKC